tara:strand:+ start:195 stop:788 length:594 start_codon:yes stop_codon:yes gene_type:complete
VIIGLTGGIASGKSTVAQQLGQLGAHVIDADKLGHNAYVSGSEAFDLVVSAFGNDTVGSDGEIDRKVLGSKVFGNAESLKKLTDIVWPAIKQMATQEILSVKEQRPEQVIVLEAAVLFEAGWEDIVDEVWSTIVDREVAIERASNRDGTDRSQVEARIDAQISNEERKEKADRLIDNSGSEADLQAQVKQIWNALSL